MFRALLHPHFLIGSGTVVMFGAAVYEYSVRYSNKTGFHVKDPDTSLRRVEKDVLIPKIMRDLSRTKLCANEVKNFNECCGQFKVGSLKSYMTFMYCKNENKEMMECMNSKFLDIDFYFECKKIYLNDKALFRLTKVEKKDRVKIKKCIEGSGKRDFEMNDRMQKYYDLVKEKYETTSDVDDYDKTLLEIKNTT